MHYRDAIFSCHGSRGGEKGLSVYSQFEEYICRFESCPLRCPLAEVNACIVTRHPCRPPGIPGNLDGLFYLFHSFI